MLVALQRVLPNTRGGNVSITDQGKVIINTDKIIQINELSDLGLMEINLDGSDEVLYTTIKEFESKIKYVN